MNVEGTMGPEGDDAVGGSPTRRFAVVVYGATGYTGQLVAQYLSEHDEMRSVPWAIAGRNEQKLQDVKANLRCGEDVGVLLASSEDLQALDSMVRQATVVLNCAGPFLRHGTKVVDRCVNAQTHYVDITGEVTWVKRMMSRYQGQAERDGVVLVPMCGFDSAPSDIAAHLLRRRAAAADAADPLRSVMGYVAADSVSGGVSGGTLESIRHLVESDAKELARSAYDTGYLCSVRKGAKPVQGGSVLSTSDAGPMAIWYRRDAGGWISPWLGAVNAKVVHRSNHLESGGSHPLHTYAEALVHTSLWKAVLYAAVFYVAVFVFLVPPLRWAAFRFVLPSPGNGPSSKTLENGGMRIVFAGCTESGRSLTLRFDMNKEPAYKCTAIIAAETTMLLLAEAKSTGLSGKAGFQTPASVGGSTLATRLKRALHGSAFLIEHQD